MREGPQRGPAAGDARREVRPPRIPRRPTGSRSGRSRPRRRRGTSPACRWYGSVPCAPAGPGPARRGRMRGLPGFEVPASAHRFDPHHETPAAAAICTLAISPLLLLEIGSPESACARCGSRSRRAPPVPLGGKRIRRHSKRPDQEIGFYGTGHLPAPNGRNRPPQVSSSKNHHGLNMDIMERGYR